MKKRNGEIDVLRFVISVMLVLYHYCQKYGFDICDLWTQGNIAVEFFFVVTGYLMAVSASKYGKAEGRELADDTWRFVLKKIGVFYKYYLTGILLYVVVVQIGIKNTALTNVARGFLQGIPQFSLTTMVLDFKHRSMIYLSNSWYLSVMIMGSFVLYPLMRRYGDVAKKLIFPVISLLLIGYLFNSTDKLSAWDNWNGHVYLGLLRGIGEMALGASLHSLAESLSVRFDWLINSKKTGPKLLLTVLKFFCYLVFFLYAKGFNLGKYYSVHALLFVSLGIVLSFMNAGYTIGESGVTRFLGKLSLPIFLFHGVIKNVLPDLIPLEAGENGKMMLLVLATVIISIVLYKLTDLLFALLGKLGTAIRKKIEA